MKIRYKVLGIHQSEANVDVNLPGRGVVSAKVPCYLVETMSEDRSMGHTFKLASAPDFKEGDTIEVTGVAVNKN